MNKWKITFIFLTGVWLYDLIAHIWLSLEGLLPFTSKLFPWLTITNDLNMAIIFLNFMLTLIFAYLGFFHSWGSRVHSERHA